MTAQPPPLFGSDAARSALQADADRQVARAIVVMRRAALLVADDRSRATRLLMAHHRMLGTLLQRYQRFKHEQIFDPVVAYGPASSKVVARTMKVDCMQLGEVFGAYQTRWPRLGAGEWPAYRADMLPTMEMLTTHLRAELRAIRQLLMISGLRAA